ncbi:MAG: metal-sulfur cluster assembly factor [Anaerolineae bacterium]|nr:MAG: metal-sulfur cluster assembly factor [Anaerolineae bacterium]
MITEEQVRQALKNVVDPEIGINVVDLGLVYNVEIEGSTVYIDMTLTSPGCPVGPQIIRDAQREAGALEGVEEADVQLIWSPPWSPDMMSEEAKDELGYY